LILAALMLPRDFSVPIVAAWIWLGFWTSAPPDPYEDVGRYLVERWLGFASWPKRSGLERFRNGWTFIGGTLLSAGLIVLIYATDPYLWVL
jgi:hypothetical protein